MSDTLDVTFIMRAWAKLSYADRLRLWWLNVRVNGVWYAVTHPGQRQTDPETLSHHFAVLAANGDPLGVQACAILGRVDPGHCEQVLRLGDHPPHA